MYSSRCANALGCNNFKVGSNHKDCLLSLSCLMSQTRVFASFVVCAKSDLKIAGVRMLEFHERNENVMEVSMRSQNHLHPVKSVCIHSA